MSPPLKENLLFAERFELQSKLGAGGFGEVWLARDTASDKQVAVKVLLDKHHKSAPARLRLAREAKLLSTLRHPAIPRCITFDGEFTPPYVVMEFVAGTSLGRELWQRASQRRHFSATEILGIFDTLTQALDCIHQCGIIHRDLKPSNVIITHVDEERCDLALVDFGVAKPSTDIEEATTAGRIIGSLLHLSPEQASAGTIDARSDVFALGVLLFEVLTLRQPWICGADGEPLWLSEVVAEKDRARTLQTLEAIRFGARPRPVRGGNEVPDSLASCIRHALSTSFNDRTPSARAFFEEAQPGLLALAALENLVGPADGTTKRARFSVPETVVTPNADTILAPAADTVVQDAVATRTVNLETALRDTAVPIKKRGASRLGWGIGGLIVTGALAISLQSRPSDTKPSLAQVAVPTAPIRAVVPETPHIISHTATPTRASARAVGAADETARHSQSRPTRPPRKTEGGARPTSAVDELTGLERDLREANGDPVALRKVSERVIDASKGLADRERAQSIAHAARHAAITFNEANLLQAIAQLRDARVSMKPGARPLAPSLQ